MSLENWGQMTKAQDDSTTIDQAIASAIADHEASPDSHLGTGKSLENHKTNEVIDHPAGSVVADKTAMTEFDFITNFDTLVPWHPVGNVTQILWPGATLSYTVEDDPNPVTSSIYAFLSLDFNTIKWNKYNLVEINLNEEIWADSYKLFVGFYYRVSDSDVRGLGFKIIDNVIYGFCGISGDSRFTSVIGSGIHSSVSLRVEWVPADTSANFYINGELVATINMGSIPSTQSDLFPRAELIYRGGDDDAVIHLSSYRFSRQI